MNLALFGTERGVLSWLSFDLSDREIDPVHPNPAAINVLTAHLWGHPQHVLPTDCRGLIAHQYKIVVVAIQLRLCAHGRLRGFFLTFQEPLEDVIRDQLRSALRNNFELFGRGPLIAGLD